MKYFYLTCLFISALFQSQVKVRGYTKKDGTYVQPHERTNPDNTKTNNYSYPGNYNPNKPTYNPYYSYQTEEESAKPIGFWKWMLYIGLTASLALGIYFGGMALSTE